MNKEFEDLKDMFIGLYANNRHYLTDEEVSKMNAQERVEVEYDEIKKEKYILEPMQFTGEEFKVFLDMKQVDLLNDQNNKINTIKNIMVFWVVLFVIMFIISLALLI